MYLVFPPRALAVALAGCALTAISLSAQQTLPTQKVTAAHEAAPVPSAGAVQRSAPISIDGKLDEDAWQAATPITQLRQTRPGEGDPATLPTEIRILYDDEALYIGAKMSEPMGRAGIRAPLARRDQLLPSNGNNGAFNSLTTDKIAILLDPYHNHLDEVWFEINPAGVRGDQFNGDPSWDPVWEGAAHIDERRLDRRDAHPVLAAPLLARRAPDMGTAGVALRGPAERAGHVVVPPPRRERRSRLLRAHRGARREQPAAPGRAPAVRRVDAASSSTPIAGRSVSQLARDRR